MAGLGDTPPSPQKLFKKVVSHYLLGSIWSQGKKPGKEHLVPTIHATVTQFDSVVTASSPLASGILV